MSAIGRTRFAIEQPIDAQVDVATRNGALRRETSRSQPDRRL